MRFGLRFNGGSMYFFFQLWGLWGVHLGIKEGQGGRERLERVKEGQSQAQSRGIALPNLTIHKRLLESLEDSIYKASFFVAAVTSTQLFFFLMSLCYSDIQILEPGLRVYQKHNQLAII